jgi:hypothetical protein
MRTARAGHHSLDTGPSRMSARARKFQLSMQCFAVVHGNGVGTIDPFFAGTKQVDEVIAHWDSICREYRVLAGWRKRFRV